MLTEYLKLVTRGLQNPGEVIKGWVNVLKEELGALPEDQLNVILERRLICGSCPFMSENAKKTGYKTERVEQHFILCSCPIKSKTANLDSTCGALYFNENHPETPLEIKWFPYEASKNREG